MIVYVLGCFASAMVSQASVARIIFSMGRDGALPRIFGVLNPKWKTPVLALCTVALVAVLSTVLTIEHAVVMINFGALVAFSMVNLSVIKYYVIDRRQRSALSVLRYALIPGLGFIVTIWLWTQLNATAFIVGFIWMTLGFIYLLVSTKLFTKPLSSVEF